MSASRYAKEQIDVVLSEALSDLSLCLKHTALTNGSRSTIAFVGGRRGSPGLQEFQEVDSSGVVRQSAAFLHPEQPPISEHTFLEEEIYEKVDLETVLEEEKKALLPDPNLEKEEKEKKKKKEKERKKKKEKEANKEVVDPKKKVDPKEAKAKKKTKEEDKEDEDEEEELRKQEEERRQEEERLAKEEALRRARELRVARYEELIRLSQFDPLA
eukprot:CAMPEP_0116934418 /NCGR_PEP_ID=MMETSP0467-20121206/29634_1 /TAXON_ID=283647 /ORGANISM="Mesodinium pulex, Strain SPMC105" /LENGTH=213 /DNA_ID=CAMNT_0004615513 /DNA_START=38 /DNA_END=682 /DNA_ORIENTATION=-